MDRPGYQHKEDRKELINVSEQLKEESKKNHNYYVTANVTLADGTKLSLEKKDFYLDGNGIIDAADSSDFPVGVAIEKTATLSLVNDKGQFDKYSFNKAVFVIFMNLQLSDRLETFKRGSFIVCKKPAIDGEINLTLLDYMSKADLAYKTNLSFPCTAREVLEDACQQSGIVLGGAEFPNSDFQVNKAPENTTFRVVIGMVAALAGGNARIDEDDLLRIITFDQKEIHHELSAVSDVQVDTDPVVITGIKYTEGDDSYLYGTEGYVLELKENQLLSGNAEDGVKRIGQILNGFEIMPFSLSHPPMGYITFGDTVHFKDNRGIEHTTYATDVEFKFADSLELACDAKSVEEQGAEFPGGGQSQIIVEHVNKAVDKKMTAYDIKLKQANELAANCLGFWYTEVTLEDGSVITYRHNKPKLEESKIVYKNAAEGSFVTNDYQGTDEATTQAGKWKAAFDSNGDAVLNILYAIGIQAGWINTRGLTAKDNDGNITFRINETTGDVEIDADNFFLGKTSLSERLEDMENTIASGKNLSIILDNDYQSIPVDANGNVIGEFPSVQTTVMVKYGTEDITSDCSFKVSTSDGVEGVWEKDLHTYTVTKLSADSAWIEFRATYLQTLSLSKKFKVSKLYAGKDGDDGKGIADTQITYQVSDSGTSVPTGIWVSSVPNVPVGKYLWTKTVTIYTDNTKTTAYSVSRAGEDGTDGKGITNTEITYQGSTSGTVVPTGTWTKMIPSVPAGQYLWTRTVFTYSDGTTKTAYSIGMMGERGLQGLQGEKGEQGIPGEKGADGRTTYFHIKYSSIANPTSSSQMSEKPDTYIGTYVDFTEKDSTDPKKYTWSKWEGKDGEKGIPGVNGADGKTSYLHIAYANSADGKTGFSKSDSTGKIYIGQYTDYEEDDSSDPAKYKWTRIKGEDGRTYFIELSANAVKRGQDNLIVPETITASAYYRDGTNASRVVYSGRWKIQTSTDGTIWKDIYTSSSNESAKTWTIKNLSKDIVSIRFVLYAAGGTTQTIDMQTIPVLVDVAALTHEEIFDLLTDSGKIKGLYKIGDQLYVSFSYARGGELGLGGKNNGNGILTVYDDSGNMSYRLTNNGHAFYNESGQCTSAMIDGKILFPDKAFIITAGKWSATQKGFIYGSKGMNRFSGRVYGNTDGTIKFDYTTESFDGYYEPIFIQNNEIYGFFDTLRARESLIAGELTGMPDNDKTVRINVRSAMSVWSTLKLYNLTHVSSGGHLVFASDGATLAYMASSSKRYKEVEENLGCMEQWYNIQPVWAKYKEGYLAETDKLNGKYIPMFLAEDVEKNMPEAAVYNKDDKIEDWNYRVMIPAMFAMLKEQHAEIQELKEQLRR